MGRGARKRLRKVVSEHRGGGLGAIRASQGGVPTKNVVLMTAKIQSYQLVSFYKAFCYKNLQAGIKVIA